MTFPIRFSIAAMLTAIAMFAGFLVGNRGEYRIPKEFEGVWIIESAVFEGIPAPLSDLESVGAGECDTMEFLISENRLVMTDISGNGAVTAIKKTPSAGSLKLEATGLGYAAIQEPETYYFLLERHGPKLHIAWTDPKALRIDESVKAGQIICKAARPKDRKTQ